MPAIKSLTIELSKNPFRGKSEARGEYKHQEGMMLDYKNRLQKPEMYGPRENKGFDLINHAIRMGGDMSGLKNNELRRHLNDRGSAEPVVARPDANLSLPSSGAQSSPKVVSQIQERANPNTFQFPWKLHDMLDTVADEGLEDVVSWEDNGRSFRVHQTQKFVESVMPRWFKQSKYKSFQRQLNLYGFTRLNHGPSKGGYMHSHFVRGKRTMCQLVTRGSGAEDELGGLESSKDSTRLNNSALDILVERSSLEGETGRAGMMPLVETTMIFRPHSMVLGGASPSIVTTSNSGNSSGIESGVSEDGDNESQTKDNLYQLPMNKEFQFPWKLYEMLDRSETESFEYIVSWQPGDFCFKVHEPTLFATSILRRFFRQSKYKSFQRQLNLYGFIRVEEGLNKGAYCHQFFVKGRKELLTKLSRQKVKDSETRKSNQENQQSPHKSEMLCPTTLYRGRSSGIPAIIAAIECSEAALSGVLDSGSAMNQITSKDMSWRQNAAENCSDWIIEVLERESRRIKSYKVHRCVLALGPRRSEYFARLFEKPDSTTKSVFELSSAEAQVFPMVLDHMYTDSQLEFDSSTAYALYFLGDQLEITSILLSVTEFYSRSMTNENIIDFLTVAMSFRDTMLLDAALDRCAGGLHYMDQTTASKIKPVVFLEVLRRSKALSNSYKLDSNRLSQLVAACMEGNRADLTLDLFFSLVDEKYLPTIESCAAIQILAVQNELACHSYGVAEMISNSLQVRCVTSIVNDWRTVKEKLVKDITLATQMEAMPSTVLFKILMTTTGSCDTKAC